MTSELAETPPQPHGFFDKVTMRQLLKTCEPNSNLSPDQYDKVLSKLLNDLEAQYDIMLELDGKMRAATANSIKMFEQLPKPKTSEEVNRVRLMDCMDESNILQMTEPYMERLRRLQRSSTVMERLIPGIGKFTGPINEKVQAWIQSYEEYVKQKWPPEFHEVLSLVRAKANIECDGVDRPLANLIQPKSQKDKEESDETASDSKSLFLPD